MAGEFRQTTREIEIVRIGLRAGWRNRRDPKPHLAFDWRTEKIRAIGVEREVHEIRLVDGETVRAKFHVVDLYFPEQVAENVQVGTWNPGHNSSVTHAQPTSSSFEHQHAETCSRKVPGGNKTVVTSSNDEGIKR